MPKLIRIPFYAKVSARRGLEERKENNAGLTKSQAKRLGINSGVERAKQILRNKYLKESEAKSVARFYLRFRNCKTNRCETALDLWGGRKFGSLLSRIYYSKNK